MYVLFFEKGTDVMYCYINRTHTLTDIFKVFTILGEWFAIVLLALYLAITNRKAFIAAALGFIPFDIVMLSLKRFLDYPRPLLYFQHGEISAMEDLPILLHQSMPSGHSFTAFFIASFLCFFYNIKVYLQMIIFSFAILIGLSRVYLMCHFLEDVLLGSILGIVAGIIPAYIYPKLNVHHAG
jgi:membrane-associated phospholipid phosphatase